MKKLLSEIRDTSPRREHGDISGLKQSIADVGLINPLTIDQKGKLLAGRRRFQAVTELGWQEVECYVLPVDGDQLKAFRVAIVENLKRKNLTEVEEAVANKGYDDLKRTLEGSQPIGKHLSLPKFGDDGWSQMKTAQDLGVSRQKISRDIKIATAIEEYPELAKRESGQAVLTEAKRRAALEKARAKQASNTGELFQLYQGDFRQICQQFEAGSISAIITDPPYGEEYIPLYSELAQEAERLLRSGGSLLVMSGIMFLPQILSTVASHLSYQWIIAFLMGSGTSRVWPRKVCQMWKPILWFVKGQYSGDWVTDVFRSTSPDKQLSEWQQPEDVMRWLVERFSAPGATILDPMMGTGTVGSAACKLGRRFIGIDLDVDKLTLAKGRMVGIE